MIEIEINGQTLEAAEGSMIIQAADEAGIYIPRFCYHKKLSIAANCRMCLVEVENSKKPLPACATPVAKGMKVFTQSENALASQRAVMEFLLINHPLDCPICDQGGECELQDLALGYGSGVSRYTEGKRVVKDKPIGPLIATEMTRCIHCTRCVRFGDEVAGMRELGGLGRGENTEIGTYIAKAVRSEMSGNVIDLCPVGALTSKPFRFSARSWELNQHESVAAHDCIGSNIFVHTSGSQASFDKRVMRAVPRENEAINETWISDRDRFSYTGLYSAERLQKPLLKQNDEWHEVSWEAALQQAAAGLREISARDPGQLAALVSPSATVEECYLLQKLVRALGSPHIDYRIRQTDFRDQHLETTYPNLGMAIADLEKLTQVLLVGSNIRHEQPIAATRLRKIMRHGGEIMALNPVDFDFHFPLAVKMTAASAEFVDALAGIAAVLVQQRAQEIPADVPKKLLELLKDVQPGAQAKAVAERLLKAERGALLLGAYALNHPEAATVKTLVRLIGVLTRAQVGYLSEGANAAGAWLAGATPHRQAGGHEASKQGFDAQQMVSQPRQAYVLLGLEPELDCALPAATLKALQAAQKVIVFSAFVTPKMREYADIILPIAAFTETEGHFVNAAGRWQTLKIAAPALGEARPAWKVLRVLGHLCGVQGFDYTACSEVTAEVQQTLAETAPAAPWYCPERLPVVQAGIYQRIGLLPMYRVDSLVRRAAPLQVADNAPVAAVTLAPETAQHLNLRPGEMLRVRQDGSEIELPVLIEPGIAAGHAAIALGLAQTAGFGAAFGEIELTRSNNRVG